MLFSCTISLSGLSASVLHDCVVTPSTAFEAGLSLLFSTLLSRVTLFVFSILEIISLSLGPHLFIFLLLFLY